MTKKIAMGLFAIIIIAGLFMAWPYLGEMYNKSIILNTGDRLEIFAMGDTIPGTKIYDWVSPSRPVVTGDTVRILSIDCAHGECSATIQATFYTGSATPHFTPYETTYYYYKINGAWIDSIGQTNPEFEIVDGELKVKEPPIEPPVEPESECSVTSDCDAWCFTHSCDKSECTGEWLCEVNECVWQCGETPPNNLNIALVIAAVMVTAFAGAAVFIVRKT